MFKPIPFETFQDRIGVRLEKIGINEVRDIKNVVSLRDIHSICSVFAMRRDYLHKIVRNVKAKNGEFVYKNCSLKTVRLDPHALKIGQTFIQRKKYVALVENFKDILSQWTVSRGIAKLTPQIIVGYTAAGECVLAHYLPPIIEFHHNHLTVMDGIHRNFLGMSIGTTLECILIEDISVPFPCALRQWNEISIVEEKPPLEQRYFDLKIEFFRELKDLGIDG